MALRQREVRMTDGSITGHLIKFALPLLAGNLFQQLYNTVDTWVVGNYVGNEAFSAVGSTGPIINMLIGFFMGLANGGGVVIAQYFGAKRDKEVHDAVHTGFMMTIVMSVFFAFAGIKMMPFVLDFMKTPAEVIPQSTAYLTIYFSGISGMMLYNVGTGILNAVGDTRRPFVFLVVSALVNTVLDLVFVIVFGMGVEGVALATVIAQWVSAVLVIITLMRSDSCVKLIPKDLRIHWDMLRKIFRIGMPAAIQTSITSFSNVFVQSYVNYFGANFMSGWTAYSKIDQFALLPMQSLALASTTFVGQNLGINNVDRAKKGVYTALKISVVITILLMIPIMIFAGPLVSFFNPKPEVVEFGTLLLRWMSPFYVLCCFNQILGGALRGSGNGKVPMVVMLFSFVLFRQAYLFVMANFISNTVIPIALAYPAGWLVCSAIMMVYFVKVPLGGHRVVED